MGKNELIEIMGTMGSLIVCMSALPQIIKTFRTKRVDDLSISYLTSLMFGMILMMVYSVHIGDPVFIFGNILSLLSTGILIFLWIQYRDRYEPFK